MIKLRDYQQDLYENIKSKLTSGCKRPLVVAGCGSGKTFLFLKICEKLSSYGTVLILVHRRELKSQHLKLLEQNGIPTKNITVESVFKIANKMQEMKKPLVIITDEAHLSKAKTWERVINHFDCVCIGFTATPIRLDGKPLGDIYDCLIESVSVRWLIDNGYLAPFDYYAPVSVDTADVKSSMGDYKTSELEKLMMKKAIYGDVIKSYKKIADGEKTIVYCVSVAHSKAVCAEFKAAGYKADCIDGTMTNKKREAVMESFRSGDIKILCNCSIISEGVSVDDCSCVILLRPTESTALYIQQAMRCMRYLPHKRAKIIDCAANYTRHSLPDAEHEWDLSKPLPKHTNTNSDGSYIVRVCKNCFRTFKTADKCPFCGTEYKAEQKELKQIKDVELKKISEAQKAELEKIKKQQRMEVGRARSRNELIAIAKKRGYDMKWVYIQCKIKHIRS